jgi:hypothetical protein
MLFFAYFKKASLKIPLYIASKYHLADKNKNNFLKVLLYTKPIQKNKKNKHKNVVLPNIVKINGKLLNKTTKYSDSFKNNILFKKKILLFNKKCPILIINSLQKNPKKMLPTVNKNKGNSISISDS